MNILDNYLILKSNIVGYKYGRKEIFSEEA